MDNTWIWVSIGAMVGYYFGLYIGIKHKPKNEIESQIQWQHAYNCGWADAMEAGWQKDKEPADSETSFEKEKWELEIVNSAENTPVLSWKSNAPHAKNFHRKTEKRKWMQ